MIRIQFDFDEFYPLHITIEESTPAVAVERVHEVLGELMSCPECGGSGGHSEPTTQTPSN